MIKSNRTTADAQLKARRTSLGKKTNEELINIILRKDSTERKNNIKIKELTVLLKEADSLNEEKATRILNLNDDMEIMKNRVAVLKDLVNFRRKVIFYLLGFIIGVAISAILICIL